MNKWKIATFSLAVLIMSMFTLGTVSSKPPVVEPDRYQNAEALIDFSLLPGIRINLWINQDIEVFEDETTHLVHGFVSNSAWSEMSAAEQTEFLSTNEFQFFYKGNQVPLNHIIRYDTQEDYMYSMFYKVFPPGFFPVGQNQVHGEWYWMQNGVWETYEDSGTIKVMKPIILEPDIYEPNDDVLESEFLGSFGQGSTRIIIEANLYPSTDVDWYHFQAAGDPMILTILQVYFWSQSDSDYKMEVYHSEVNDFSTSYLIYEGWFYTEFESYGWYWIKIYHDTGNSIGLPYYIDIEYES